MGVRITDLETVALYDSTTGMAFGPTFERESEAEAFLAWLKEGDDIDARKIPVKSLVNLLERFRAVVDSGEHADPT